MKLLLCIIVTIAIVQLQVVTAQNVATKPYVRLVNGTKASDGTLQVFLQGRWNTVCNFIDGFELNIISLSNIETWDTACRQLGYTHMSDFLITQDPPIGSPVVMGINCSEVFYQEKVGEVFLQRCQLGPVRLFDRDTCASVVGVRCDNRGDPYDGQVRTANEGQYFSVLESSYKAEWRPICVKHDEMNDFVANTACRQMGFTSSSLYRPSDNNGPSWKISLNSDLICKGFGRGDRHQSYSCFTICVNVVDGYTAVDTCGRGYSQYELVCKFDMDDQLVYKAGNALSCKYDETTLPIVNFGLIAGLNIAGILILILVIVVIVQCYTFYCRRRLAAGPRYSVVTQTINDDNL